MPSTGPTTGWRRHGDGKMAAKMVRFRQSDIDEGRMWYQHNGVADRTDAIHFKVRLRGGSRPAHGITSILILGAILGVRFICS